jgi:uncharacterized HAD superfamily protein
MKCFLIDIDGTVANGDHRLHHIQKEPKAWDDYFLECGKDAPIEHMRAVVIGLSEHARIVYVSGRSDLVRQQTIDWFDRHGFPCDALYMRKQGDHENDDTLKIKLLAQVRADGFDPIMAFDDRNRVVRAWRAAGIPCAQVAEGDF